MRISDWSSDGCSSDLLPVFEHGRDEVSIRGVLAQGYGLLAVNGQFFIFEIPAGNPLADDAGGEQQQQDDGQSVILEEVRHLTLRGSSKNSPVSDMVSRLRHSI